MLDNMIKKINRRLQTAESTLGTGSALYSRYKAVISRNIAPAFIKMDAAGRISISRSKNIKGLGSKDITTALNNIFDHMQKNRVTTEKAELRKFAKEMNYPKKSKFTVKDYRELSNTKRDLSDEYQEALDYLYEHSSSDEAQAAIALAGQKGKKTYSELKHIIETYKKLETRNDPVWPRASSTLVPDSIPELPDYLKQ